MKSTLLVFVIVLLAGCRNTAEKATHDLFAQNNHYYQIKLDEFKLECEAKKLDMPAHFEDKFIDRVFKSVKAIGQLKDQKDYCAIYEALKKLSYQKKLKKIIEPIASDDKEVLKNNLYLNLMNLIQAYEQHEPIVLSTHCMFSGPFWIKQYREKDSMKLDFCTSNQYRLVIDSIKDGNAKPMKYVSEPVRAIWSVRYKPTSPTTRFDGKMFMMNDYNSFYQQEFHGSIPNRNLPLNSGYVLRSK